LLKLISPKILQKKCQKQQNVSLRTSTDLAVRNFAEEVEVGPATLNPRGSTIEKKKIGNTSVLAQVTGKTERIEAATIKSKLSNAILTH